MSEAVDKQTEIWYNILCKINYKLATEVNGMSALEGFTSFNFNEGVAYASITKNGVTFNKAVVMKLGYPQYVVLLINEASQQIAIQCCDESTPNHTAFYKQEKSKNVISVRWNGKDLLNTISEMMGWNLEQNSYRINGSLLKEESAMLFDLKSADMLN